jgi:hypothetical protein
VDGGDVIDISRKFNNYSPWFIKYYSFWRNSVRSNDGNLTLERLKRGDGLFSHSFVGTKGEEEWNFREYWKREAFSPFILSLTSIKKEEEGGSYELIFSGCLYRT